MNASSYDIKDILEAESSLGLTFATNLFIAFEPSSPNNCVTIYDTPSRGPQLTTKKGEDYYYPSVQIRVRNTSFLTGYDLAEKIQSTLHGLAHETWNGTLYTLIQCTQSPALLNWDENGRCHIVMSFNIQRR